jgi:hypothetical protein
MAGGTNRHHYYWQGGRLVRRRVERPTGFGPWPPVRDEQYLVAIIERTSEGIKVLNGPAHNSVRGAEAIRIEHGHRPSDVDPTVDVRVPVALIDQFKRQVTEQIVAMTKKYPRMGSEDRTTGALFDRLEGTIGEAGWTLQLFAYHYSNTTKENIIGADAGVVFDLVDPQGKRAYKSLLIQAKRSASVPVDVNSLPRVEDQRKLMEKYTSQGYVWLYTPKGMVAYAPDDSLTPIPALDVLVDSLACRRGDRDSLAISNALDSRHVLEVLVTPP